MTNDASLFVTQRELEAKGCLIKGNDAISGVETYVPLYEAKLATMFNHRGATFEGIPESDMYGTRAGTLRPTLSNLDDPEWTIVPRYWVTKRDVMDRIPDFWQKGWLAGFRNAISAVADARSVTFTILPPWGAGNSLPLLFSCSKEVPGALLITNFNSFVLDYVAKQKASGGNLNYYILKQLPMLCPSKYSEVCEWFLDRKRSYANSTIKDWLLPRILELTYTSWDMHLFAKELGYNGPPFHWDEARRFQIRCELDAAYFHLYEIERDDVDYIMETFVIVKRKDEGQYGSYRTKDTILRIFDQLWDALTTNNTEIIARGEAIHDQSVPALDPGPPTDPDGNFLCMYQWDRDKWPVHMHQPHPYWDDSIFAAWYDVCQHRTAYVEDDQIFPRAGRETFVYALLPYLVQERPGEQFEFYRDAALLASRPTTLERLLLNKSFSSEYRRVANGIPWLNFADGQRIDPRRIRETLQRKQIIHTAADSGVTEICSKLILPPLPTELMPLLSLVLQAADNLNKMQLTALENAEAANISLSQDEIANELKTLFAM